MRVNMPIDGWPKAGCRFGLKNCGFQTLQSEIGGKFAQKSAYTVNDGLSA